MGEKVQLAQEKETLLMTLYLRALDNRGRRPILADAFAQGIVDKIDYDFDRLGALSGNAPLIATRGRRFDEWVGQFLADSPEALVLHLAAGLDSRPLRIARPASALWIDVDYPEVIELRKRLYGPIEGVRMLGSSVTEPQWWDQLPTDRPTLIVAEGLLMYLSAEEVHELLSRALEKFISGQVIFDGVAPWVKAVSGLQPSMRRAGTGFRWAMPEPRAFARDNPPLRLIDQESAIGLIGQHRGSLAGQLIGGFGRLPGLRNAMQFLRYGFGPAV